MKLWQYKSQVDAGGRTTWDEQVSLDKFQQPQSIPQRNWAQARITTVALLALAPTLFFVNLGQPEAVHPDSWQFPQSQPTRNFTVQTVWQDKQVLIPSFFFTPQPASQSLEWQQPQSQPSRNFAFQTVKQDGFLSSVPSTFNVMPSEAITVDKWHPVTQQPRLEPKRLQYLYPPFVNDTLEEEDVIEWHPAIQQPYLTPEKLQYLFPSFTTDALSLTQPEQVSADKFVQPTNNPYPYKKQWQFLYPSFFNDNFQPGPLTTEWLYPIEQPYPYVKHREFQFPNFWNDPKQFVAPETIFPDKYHPLIQQPRFERKKLQYLYPVTTDTFTRANEPISVDKWFALIQQPRFQRLNTNFQAPSSFFNPRPVATPHSNTNIIIVDGKVAIQLHGKFYTIL